MSGLTGLSGLSGLSSLFGTIGTVISYILRDDFTTNEASPLASPRTCDGVGNATLIQNDGTFDISGGNLVTGAHTSDGWGELVYSSTDMSNEAGALLVFSLSFNNATDGKRAEFGIGATPIASGTRFVQYPLSFGGGYRVGVIATGFVHIDGRTETANTQINFGIIPRTTGAFFIRKDVGSEYKMIWIDETISTSTMDNVLFDCNSFEANVHYIRQSVSGTYTPTPTASDSFDRTNSSALGSTDGAGVGESGGSGLAWTEESGDWKIASNRLVCDTLDGGTSRAQATVDTGVSDGVVRCTMRGAAGSSPSLLFRFNDDDNFWIAMLAIDAAQFRLYERTGGTFTLRGSGGAAGVSADTDYEVTSIVDGTSITIWKNGDDRLAYTSSDHETETKYGAYCEGTLGSDTEQYENFQIWPRELPEVPDV